MAKSTPKSKLPKQSGTKNSETNKEVKIKDFSILVDIANIIAENQNKLNKSFDSFTKNNKDILNDGKDTKKSLKDISGSLKDVSSKIDSLSQTQKESSLKLDDLIEKQKESNLIAKDESKKAALAAEFSEERIAEQEREKLLSQELATEKEEKDRATIISKLTALEEKDLEVNVQGKGSGGFGLGNLLSGLGKLAAVAGLLTAGFMALKDFINDLISGDFFTDKEFRTPEMLGGQAGLSMGARASAKAMKTPLDKSAKNFGKAQQAGKAALTGKPAQPAPSTPKAAPSGTATATPKPGAQPKLSTMQRIGQGGKAVYEGSKGVARRLEAGVRGVATTTSLKGMTGSAATGGIVSGIAGGAIEAAAGGDAKDIAYAAGGSALKGAALSTGFRVGAGLTVSAAGAVGGQVAAKAAARAIPFLGWGLMAYDLIKFAENIGEFGRTRANQNRLNELQDQMKTAVTNSQKLFADAEKIKDSDPEQYNRLIEMGNNNMKANAKQFSQFHAIVQAENALDQLVDMDKSFAVGPFGLWDRGDNYSLTDVENHIRYLKEVEGKTTQEKIENVFKSPSVYKGNVSGLQTIVDNLGLEDSSKLLGTEGQTIIDKYKKDREMHPVEYFEKYFDLPDPEKQEMAQMRKGAALIHSNSAMGTPVMAGEKGNPETIIPLNKFDEVISDYLTSKDLTLKLESKSYDDMTNYIRDSYLEEKLESVGNNITINNISSPKSSTASSDQGANFQFQTDLAKTFDNVFEMILEKNMRTGLA